MHRIYFRPSRLGAFLSLLGFLVASVTFSTSHAQGWSHVVNLGGLRGSAIGGGSGNTIYAGLGTGQVFRSDDNGITWVGVTNGLVDSAGRMLLPKAFVTTPTGRVIRGGDNASWENKAGSPIFYTDNRGARWTEVPLPFGSPTRNPAGIGISDLVMHQGAIYFSDLLSEGVWKSTDDGLTWKAAGEQLPTAPFIGFAKTYYAIASAGDALLTVQASRGVFRSVDGGANWAQAVNGIPGVVDSPLVGGRSWVGHDVVGAPDGTAFAVVDGRLYRSRDGGASWTEVGSSILIGPNPFVPTVLQPIARKVELLGDTVYVATSDGNPRFFEGKSLGESWTELPRIPVGGETPSILGQSFAAHNGALYAAGTNGIHRLNLATAVRTNLLPRVTTTPAGPFGVNLGGTLRVSAAVQGTAPFAFEWRINDVAVAGQTGATLAFSPTSVDQGGALTLVVRNAAGSVTNTVGNVTVAPVGPGAVDFAFRPVVSSAGFFGTSAPIHTFAFGSDGSVFLGGGLASSTEFYQGVRRIFADGTADGSFVTGALIGSGTGPGAGAGNVNAILPLGDGSVLVGAPSYYRRLRADGSLDASWPWPSQLGAGPYKIQRLADGKFLVASGSLGGMHRLNADGSFDATFQGPSSIGRLHSDYVRDFVLLPDGRIVMVGRFDTVDGVRRVGIARLLPGGQLDRSWVPAEIPAGGEVRALVVYADGRILIGGAFQSVGGQPRRGLALLMADGSLDSSLGDLLPATNPAGAVQALAMQPDGQVWVGGTFYGPAGFPNSLFRLKTDFTIDTGFPSFGFAARASINALTLTPEGRLYIATAPLGDGGPAVGSATLYRVFTDVMGPTVGYAGWDQTPNHGDSIVLRGTVNGPYTGLQWRFNGSPMAGATGLELSLANVTAANSGRYELAIASAGGTYVTPPATVRVRGAVSIDVPPLPQVGVISNAVTFAVDAFGRLPLAYQWFREGAPITAGTNRTLVLTNLQLGMAGDYSVRVSGADASTVTSDPAFLTVIPPPGSTNAGFRLGLFRTTTFTQFKDIVFLPDGRVVVAGNFATVTNGPNALLARLLPDGTVDATFRFDPSGLTELVALERQSDGRLVVLARSGQYLIRRLNEDGSRDSSFPDVPTDFATDLALPPDGGILAIGSAGVFRLGPDGQPDAAFNARARIPGGVSSLSLDASGRIYVSGGFSSIEGQPRPRLARLLPDGALDTVFVPTNAISVGNLSAQADGVLMGDTSGFYRFDGAGREDKAYGWSSRLQVWDLDASGGLVGVLNSTAGEGIIRRADGTPAMPVSVMKVPASFSSYQWVRVAPDGAYWLALGGSGAPVPPATMLFRLNGTVTSLALVTSPQSQTVDAGTTVTLTAAATGTSRVSYQWQRNGADLPGQTNATLVLSNVQTTDTGDYVVVARNLSGSTASRPATLVVLGAPEILALNGTTTLGVGDSLVLTVSARGKAPLAYRWRRNGADIPGATGASYTNRAVAPGDAGSYDVVVSNGLGSATSRALNVAVSVRPGAVVNSFPEVALGQNVKELNVLPDGSFLADGRALNRFGETLFSLPLTTTDLRERIVVDAAAGRIYMIDGPKLAFDLQGRHLTEVPRPAMGNRLVRLEATGSLLVSDNGITPSLARVGAAGVLLTNFTPALRPVMDAWPLPDGRVMVLSYGQQIVGGNFVYDTTVARLLADGANDPGFRRSTNRFALGGRAERLMLDRQGRILVFGAFTSFDGQPRSRIVRLLPDGGVDPAFQPATINGGIEDVAEQLNGRLVIAGAFTQVGGLPRSLIARLNADGSHDESFQPGTGLTVTTGQNVAMDVKVLPGGEIVVAGTFQFADGLPRRGLAMLAGDLVDIYFVKEPADAELMAGASVDLVSEGAGNSAVSYQWFKDGVPLPGETGATLRLSNASAATAGDYQVRIRNASAELASRVARVSLLVPPIVVTPPQPVVADVGATVTFGVVAEGLRLGYQWRLGDTPIAGATNRTLSLTGIAASQAGDYGVVVSNPAGSVVSSTAKLRIRPVVSQESLYPTNRLVAELRFEGDFEDSEDRFGTGLVGAPTLVEGLNGGQAARLRPGVDSLQLGGSNLRLVTTNYSASFWVSPEERGSINVYSFVVTVGTAAREHYLYLGGDDTAASGQRIFLATRGLRAVYSADDRAYVPNLIGKWTHIAVVYRGVSLADASNFSVYVDGEALTLTNSSNTIGGSAQSGAQIGRYGPSQGMRLDDFRLYNRALTAEEVRQLHRPVPPTPAPVVVRQPVGGAASQGGTFALSVEASGADLFYEWYRGTNLLAGADGATLNLTGLTAADAGDYRVVLSNQGGRVTSATATLTVSAGVDPYAAWAAAAGLSGDRAAVGADPDGDSANNAAEFAYGTSPVAPGERPSFEGGTTQVGGVSYPTITYVRRLAAGSFRIEAEVGSSLAFDDASLAPVVTRIPLGDGRERVTVRGVQAAGTLPAQFFRFTVRQ